MKFTKLLIALLVGMLMFAPEVQAQKIDWGVTEKSNSKFYMPNIIGEDDKGIYVKTGHFKGIKIEKFDKKKGNRIFSVVVEKPEIKKTKAELERVVFANDKLIGFSSVYYKKEKKMKMYAYDINIKTGKISKKKTELFTFDAESKSKRGDFFILQSKDNSKILVNHVSEEIKKVKKKNKKGKLKKKKELTIVDQFKMYTSDFELITERVDKFNSENRKDYRTSHWTLDNDGSIYYLRHYLDGSYVVSYDVNKEYEKWEEKVSLPAEAAKTDYITDVHLHLNAKNDMILVGYLSGISDVKKKNGKNKSVGNTLKGMFVTKIENFSKEIVLSKISEFDQEFKNELRSKRQAKKNRDVVLPNAFHNVKIIDKADGGIVFTGEQYEHYFWATENGHGERITYGNIIALNISSEGDLEWAKAIKKKQIYWYQTVYYRSESISFPLYSYSSRGLGKKYVTHDFFGYAPVFKDGKLVIIYNDHPENGSRTQSTENMKRFKNPKKGVAMAFEIDMATGKADKKPYFGAKSYDVLLVPRVYFQNGQYSDIIMFGKKKKKIQFGIIEVNDKPVEPKTL